MVTHLRYLRNQGVMDKVSIDKNLLSWNNFLLWLRRSIREQSLHNWNGCLSCTKVGTLTINLSPSYLHVQCFVKVSTCVLAFRFVIQSSWWLRVLSDKLSEWNRTEFSYCREKYPESLRERCRRLLGPWGNNHHLIANYNSISKCFLPFNKIRN